MHTIMGKPAMRRIDIEDMPEGPLKDACWALIRERLAERKDFEYHRWFAHRSSDKFAVAEFLLNQD